VTNIKLAQECISQGVCEESADSLVVVDFETTGLSPEQGDRVIEVGAVRIERGTITQRFQQLINPGVRVNSFIES